MFLRFFDMTLQKTYKKSRVFRILKKERKKRSQTMICVDDLQRCRCAVHGQNNHTDVHNAVCWI